MTPFAAELAGVRADLADAWAAALPEARAAVLSRLWRGLVHDPIPWVWDRERTRDGVALLLADGRRLEGPAADPYATDAFAPSVRLGGVAYERPERLTEDLRVPGSDSFARELAGGTASLALSRANRSKVSEDWPADGWGWEQRVTDGHPFHPNCRSRPGFSVAEQLAYGPEHRPVVDLRLLPVHADECVTSGSWPERLRDGERLLLPVHPWQAEHVLGGEGPSENTGKDRLPRTSLPRTLLPRTLAAHPLMSLRTLALPGAGPHVKTALTTRLTSSVRDISVASVAASASLSDFAERLVARLDGTLRITRTLGAAAAGSPDLAAVLREPPEAYAGPGEHVVPLAALPATGLPASPAWLADLTRLALTVCLRLLETGVALEAHGQNLLVVLSPGGAPVRLVYRDLADVRLSPARLARHGLAVPPGLPARNLTDDERALRRKLFGSLVAGALAATAGSSAALGAALETALKDVPDGPDTTALREKPLPAKALTLMRLSPETQGDLWTELPNPLQSSRF